MPEFFWRLGGNVGDCNTLNGDGVIGSWSDLQSRLITLAFLSAQGTNVYIHLSIE